MAVLGNVVAPPAASTGLVTGFVWSGPPTGYLLGRALAVPGDDGSGIGVQPASPTTGQLWPRGNW